MTNKKGDVGAMMVLGIVLFIVLFAGILLAVGVSVIDFTVDEIMPPLTSIGMVGSANMTQYSQTVLDPVDSFIQSWTWLSGVVYVLILIGCFGLAFAFRFTGNKWLAAFFIGIMLMLIIASIFISNIYEEFYRTEGELGDRLKDQQFLSFFILYSPMIMSIVGFACGIIMLTGEGGEQAI